MHFQLRVDAECWEWENQWPSANKCLPHSFIARSHLLASVRLLAPNHLGNRCSTQKMRLCSLLVGHVHWNPRDVLQKKLESRGKETTVAHHISALRSKHQQAWLAWFDAAANALDSHDTSRTPRSPGEDLSNGCENGSSPCKKIASWGWTRIFTSFLYTWWSDTQRIGKKRKQTCYQNDVTCYQISSIISTHTVIYSTWSSSLDSHFPDLWCMNSSSFFHV